MGDFHDYYNGRMTAPIPTVFIGGNHEASSYLKELKFGGWVAPNIYYLGEFGCIWFKGIQIGGISGIFNQYTFRKYLSRRTNDDEKLPYDSGTIKSIYHVKPKNHLKMFMMSQDKRLDIVLSHDWPQHIEKKGNLGKLLREKPFFKADINKGSLGSPLNRVLFEQLRPRYWFSSHLHVRFEAQVKQFAKRSNQGYSERTSKKKKIKENKEEVNLDMDETLNKEEIDLDMDETLNKEEVNLDMDEAPNNEEIVLDMDETPNNEEVRLDEESHEIITNFLALDKCLPRRKFLEVMEITVDAENPHNPSNAKLTPSEPEPIFYHDKRAIAVNKVIESFVSTQQEWHSIRDNDFYDFPNKQKPLFDELNEEIAFEILKLNKLPSEAFHITPSMFKIIAPTSDENKIPLKYWENNQTTEYCKMFLVPYQNL